jgi:hypothetical protein
VYPCETARFGSRAKLTAAALEYLILQIFRFRQYVCSSWNHTRLNTSENFTRISRLTTLETSFGKTTGFHCDLVTSPLQCYRSLQPFSAFRLGGEGRADTSVDGCCIKDGRPDCCRERLAPAAISSSRRPRPTCHERTVPFLLITPLRSQTCTKLLSISCRTMSRISCD